MPVTFEPLLRFYFFKMLNRSELNFLLIDHLSTCLPVTTRQKSPRGDFAKNGFSLVLTVDNGGRVPPFNLFLNGN